MICTVSACSGVGRSTESAVHIRQSGEPWILSAAVFLLLLRLCGCLEVAAHPVSWSNAYSQIADDLQRSMLIHHVFPRQVDSHDLRPSLSSRISPAVHCLAHSVWAVNTETPYFVASALNGALVRTRSFRSFTISSGVNTRQRRTAQSSCPGFERVAVLPSPSLQSNSAPTEQ